MNDATLTVIRGKLTALETGYLVGMLDAEEVKADARQMLADHPSMPAAERARAEALLLATDAGGAPVM